MWFVRSTINGGNKVTYILTRRKVAAAGTWLRSQK